MSRKSRQRRRQRGKSHAPTRREDATRALPFWKKALFAAVLAAMFFGGAEAVLFLAGYRPRIVREDPFVGFTSRIPLFTPVRRAGGTVMVTAQNKLPWFNAQEFAQEKPAGTYRIFCLGGSTTYGRPYNDATSFCGWLRELLPAADASRRWEVINAGGISYASYRVALVLEELVQYQPDLVIVYTGHNEFLEHRTYDSLRESSALTRRVAVLLSHTRTYSAVHQLVHGQADGAAPRSAQNMLPAEVATRLDKGVGPNAYTRDDALKERILEHFKLNLHRIIDIARAAGADVMLAAPASNLLDCSPFKSETQADLSVAQQDRLHALVETAKQHLSRNEAVDALAAADEALAIDPRYAAAHFLRGRSLEQLGRYDEARQALIRARDEDICPLRALSPIREAVLRVARRRQAPVIDCQRMVDEQSPRGIPGENLFLDHVHPTIEGHRLLSLAMLRQMIDRGLVDAGADWNDEAIERVTQLVGSRVDRRAQGEALRNLAKVFTWAGKRAEANRLALQAAELLHSDANALYLAANALIAQGELKPAEEKLRQVLAVQPDDTKAMSSLGVIFQKQGRPAAAERQYRRILEIDPQDAAALNNLGALYVDMREWGPAVEYLKRAVSVNPRHAKAYHNLGVAHVKQRRWDAAAANLERAVRIDPDLAQAHADLGAVHEARRMFDKAVFHYRQALRLDPGLLKTANALAWLLATNSDQSLRDGPEAVRFAERCAEGTGYQQPGVLNTLAAAHAEAGNFEQAVHWQRQALQLAPEPMKAMCRRQLKLYQSGEPFRQ